MRLFFGLQPDSESALAIAAWRERQLPLLGRPVPEANLHITLAFLGDVSAHRLERLDQAVGQFVEQKRPPGEVLTLNQLGYWPRPGICWLGPQAWSDSLAGLARSLSRLGTAQGSKGDRGKYRPHITLMRGCDSPPPAAASEPLFRLSFDHFNLYQSHQGRSGVTYQVLESWPLG
jgi:RNA 2',3'-cyclic 3'-phosphodiesterase